MDNFKFFQTSTSTLATMAETQAKDRRRTLPWWLRPFLAKWLDSLIEVLTELRERIPTGTTFGKIVEDEFERTRFLGYCDRVRDTFAQQVVKYPVPRYEELRTAADDFFQCFDKLLERYRVGSKPTK